jgi:hypothetical protein
MRHRDFYDYEPEPEHPAKRERPRDIAALYVHKSEWDDFSRIRQDHGPTEIVGVRRVPIIPAFDVDVLCEDSAAARAVTIAWGEFCETSPHRPHGKEEALAWGEQFHPYPDIARDWTF